MRYFEEARHLWQTFVPSKGQAATVQGELIRAVEKLRDEAQRNGNCNWDEGHEILARFIRDTLLGSKLFGKQEVSDLKADITRILDYENPEVDDEPYDRITDRIVEWARAHPEPVPHVKNPKLRR